MKINLKLCFDDKLHLKLCFVRISCLIRRLTKRWNSRRIWKICYVFNFQLKKIRSKIIQITLIELWSFISWCPKKQNLVAAFLSWKFKKKKHSKFGTNLDTSSSVEYDMKSTLMLKILLKLCFDVKINLKLCFENKIHLKLSFWLENSFEIMFLPKN